MNKLKRNFNSKFRSMWFFWTLGLGSLIWLLLRSGTKLRRLAYPCQRAALLNSLGFVGYLLSLLGSTALYRRLRQNVSVANVLFFALAILITSGVTRSIAAPTESIWASPTLPAWEGTAAVSNVFAVTDVPVPQCSLDGGTLPSSPACDTAAEALHDDGIDSLINLMEAKGDYFYKTTAHPNGIVGANDVVVIKVNNQWGGVGAGRLATNTDVLKGFIWKILQHPGTFTGEIVVAENTQPIATRSWNVTPANAQDTNQSFQDVVNAFRNQGYTNVSLKDWTTINNTNRINGGYIGDIADPNNITGEYINGNNSDAYIMIDDPARTATNEYSYPKFQTINGTRVSMHYGVWNGASYNSDQLTFINMPVLKYHVMAGATIAWKNLIGFLSADDINSANRYDDSWDTMHDYYWGYTGGTNKDYGLLGREIALIRAPDLHLIDALWVATQSNYASGPTVEPRVLLSSTDPFAVDWYASEYVLYPYTSGNSLGSSAARAGTFRNATRTNQNSARLVWPGGSSNYPYIDLLDAYNGSTPSNDEKNQMNVYVNEVSTSTAANNDFATTDEDTQVIVNVLANDTAATGTSLVPGSVTVPAQPPNGTATPNANGTITYTPNLGYKGADSFNYEVCDDAAVCDTAMVTIIVSPFQVFLPVVLKN